MENTVGLYRVVLRSALGPAYRCVLVLVRVSALGTSEVRSCHKALRLEVVTKRAFLAKNDTGGGNAVS